MDSSSQSPQKSALDRIENTLYDPKKKPESFVVHEVKSADKKQLPNSWSKDSSASAPLVVNQGLSVGTKILLLSIFVLVVSFGFTAYKVLSSKNVISAENIDIILNASPYIESGENLPLTVSLVNRNAIPLESSSISLLYKKGVGSQDEEEKVTEKRDIGSVQPNESHAEDFSLILFGGEAEERTVTVKFEYKVTGSNAVFSKIAAIPVVLKTPSMSLTIDGAKTISFGQEGTYQVTVRNNTSTTSAPSVLVVNLPNSFSLTSSNPSPYSRTTSWAVPALRKGESKTISFTGTITGSTGEVASMKAVVGSPSNSNTEVGVVYASSVYDVELRSSPLLVTLSLDTDRGSSETLRYGDDATVALTYKNTSSAPLKSIALILTYKGGVVIDRDVKPDTGFYDSTKNTVSWDTSSLPDLGTLMPDQERTVKVRLPIALKGTNSPKLSVEVTGVASLSESGDVSSKVSKQWAVQGSASVNAATLYKTASFVNTGPVPPVANEDTTYAARLTISAQNTLTDSSVTFTLPGYVTWRNVYTNRANVVYDPRTRLVTWTVNRLEAGKSSSVDIGLSIHPSQSHVGTSPYLTSSIVLDATEDNSRLNIKNTISGLTTYISGENWSSDPSKVISR